MRKARDGEATRKTVLAAAREAFAEKGFAGTSLARISKKCGISDGLILHHFGSKENLYQAVLDDMAGGYVALFTNSGEQHSADGGQQAVEVLHSVFRYWSEDDTYQRISMWAYLENRSRLVEEEAKLTAALAGVLQGMQMQGSIDASYSPFVLLTMIIGPIQYWVRYRALFKEALHLEQSLEELDELFLREFLGLIQKLFQVSEGNDGK